MRKRDRTKVKKASGGGGSGKATRAGWLFMLPGILLNGLFWWIPLVLGFVIAFQTYRVVGPATFSGLANFRSMFRDPMLVIVFRNTLYYTLLSLALVFLIPIVVSILIMEMRKGVIRIMMILWFIPIASMASLMIWKWFYNPDYGLFNAILTGLGLPASRWLGNPDIAMLCLVLPGLIMFGPGLIYIASLQSIPDSFYEAADLEGTGLWQKIWYITLPRLRPVIAVMLIMAIIQRMQVFEQSFVMTGGGPGNATRSVVMLYYRVALEQFRFGKGQSIALLLFTVLMVLIYLQRRFFKENLDK